MTSLKFLWTFALVAARITWWALPCLSSLKARVTSGNSNNKRRCNKTCDSVRIKAQTYLLFHYLFDNSKIQSFNIFFFYMFNPFFPAGLQAHHQAERRTTVDCVSCPGPLRHWWKRKLLQSQTNPIFTLGQIEFLFYRFSQHSVWTHTF